MDISTRPVFIVSDHTGLTAENMARSLLSRFEGSQFRFEHRPFTDTPAKMQAVLREVAAVQPSRPLVFSSLTNPEYVQQMMAAGALVCDLFAPFLGILEAELGAASHQIGQLHSIRDPHLYQNRMDAVEFSLATDDGLNPQRYPWADVIVMGVSRAGKTPTSLFLALQHGLRAANYPLTDADLETTELPADLRPFRERLFGLTIEPQRLHHIRTQRRPGSPYASLDRCQYEVKRALWLYQGHGIPVFDTTRSSVEEITSSILAQLRRGG